MNTPRDILSDLRTHLEVEIQAGRRRAPLDPAAVKAFLLGAEPAPAAAPVAARTHRPAAAATAVIALSRESVTSMMSVITIPSFI